ncbi:Two-component sensor histidine kinase, contains HisKA and HATPase domains [Chitinophaga sp. YR627]|uniref:tetratricopeptide repeat-containing sensor histidine kinase n=1 Tax=Chitinophaga sp. YR627 TaxID=1881041 RepID=UPI0008DFDEA4|nr:sensor histidine kinase [Chitinophaga sp. YR627]SFM89873.1 Two-component sensor histidine kinase, contains HisKA and HATPase domains [Chitinophaga sp. YR627]
MTSVNYLVCRSDRHKYWLLQLILILFHTVGFCQSNSQQYSTQRLLLKLAAAELNVARQNQIDLDSGLALAGARARLNTWLIAGEGFSDILSNPQNTWIATRDVRSAKIAATRSTPSLAARINGLVGFVYAFQPGTRKENIDSAVLYLLKAQHLAQTTGDLKTVCQCLTGLGKCYLKTSQTAIADSLFLKVISLAGSQGFAEEQAAAFSYWGTYSFFQPTTILDRITHLRQADVIYHNLGKKEERVAILTNIGFLSFAAGKKDDAKNAFLQAFAIEKAIGFPYTHYTTDVLSIIGATNGDRESQLKYAMETVRTAELTKDSIALAYFFSNRSVADQGYATPNYDESIMWARKSLAEFERLGGDPAMYTVAFNLAANLISKQKTEEAIQLIERLLKSYPPANPIDRQEALLTLGRAYGTTDVRKAEQAYIEAERLQKETVAIRGNLGEDHLYLEIGEFYYRIHKYAKSRSAFLAALNIPNFIITFESLASAHSYLARIDSAMGDYKSAYAHAMLLQQLMDTARVNAGSKRMDELRVRYETQKKEDDIKLLNREAAVQQARINEDKLTKKAMLAGSALLLLVLCLLYSRFRLKQRTNVQLEQQKGEISDKNASLQRLVEEKEWLLREVHHRVKNNLHTVICLLESQAAYLEKDALKALEVVQHRIYAMSLIHQRLYQSGDMKTIDMSVYLPEFIHYLGDSFGTGGQIRFEIAVDPLNLPLSQAIPIALILNEAITNSIKYAFPENRKGNIEISMRQSYGNIILVIADNGVGFDPNISTGHSGKLGLKLIRGLSEDIHGDLQLTNNNGAKLTIIFSVDPLNEEEIAVRQEAPEKISI